MISSEQNLQDQSALSGPHYNLTADVASQSHAEKEHFGRIRKCLLSEENVSPRFSLPCLVSKQVHSFSFAIPQPHFLTPTRENDFPRFQTPQTTAKQQFPPAFGFHFTCISFSFSSPLYREYKARMIHFLQILSAAASSPRNCFPSAPPLPACW